MATLEENATRACPFGIRPSAHPDWSFEDDLRQQQETTGKQVPSHSHRKRG